MKETKKPTFQPNEILTLILVLHNDKKGLRIIEWFLVEEFNRYSIEDLQMMHGLIKKCKPKN